MAIQESDPNSMLFADLLDDFFAECDEHLATVRRDLLSLDQFVGRPQVDRALLEELFRSFHSIKGLAGMVGLREAEQLSHEMESYLRALLQQQVALRVEAINALIEGTRLLEQVVAAFRLSSPMPAISGAVATLKAALPGAAGANGASKGSAQGSLSPDEQLRLEAALERGDAIWRVLFTPSPALSERGVTVNSVRAQLQQAGELIRAVPLVLPGGGIAFTFLLAAPGAEPALAPELDEVLEREPYEPAPAPAPAGPALAEPSVLPAHAAPSTVVRVDLARLDDLMNMVGDLVISRARMDDQVRRIEQLLPVAEWRTIQETALVLGRQIRDLRRSVMQVRMVPLSEVFSRMQFVIRDLAQESGKQVRLELSGQETEIDKYVVERMLDPLLHLVRNAVSHGLETPAERVAAGKPESGRIVLRALTEGDMVTIKIEDDGRGVDPAAIAARARALGMLAPEEALSEARILDVICAPGFSTREQADRVSGRGVGMDVVKKTVFELGGTLELDTTLGQGTRFTIQLPITLAITDALIVAVGTQTFAVPLPAVREVIEVQPDAVTRMEQNELLRYRGGVLPLLRLDQFFGLAPGGRGTAYALVIGGGATAIGITIDRILGKREIVVRTLSDPLVQVPGFAGATELGDGRAVLILDPSELAHAASTRRPPARRPA